IAPVLKITDDRNNIHHGDKVVLIIEDDTQFASLLRDFAREHHYKAVIALQGDDGLVYAKRYKPDAIILDIKLPVIDGWTLLKLLKEDEKLKNIPVHVITGTEYIGAAPGNVITYLKKPVDKQDLENTFESLIENTLIRFKKLLILSGDYLTKDSLTKLIEKRHSDIECTYANNIEEGMQQLTKNNFDGIIADTGRDVEKAKNNLKQLQEKTSKYNIPVIVYLDADISTTDELELMKLSDVVIRNAEMSKNRLMDELELFLYKVQEVQKEEEHMPAITNDKIFCDKKVLLVDDDMRNVFVLSSILEENKMKVTAAVNGKDAINELKKHPETDIVLMDIMMPEMDGYQTMEMIRHELGLVNLPIIALTAKAMTGDKEKCIKAGASDYISKPVDVNKLLSLMRVWLAQQK
ncbi:MAG TPA: response regulator, partial [Chitinophagaceae bacterium]|nr:response regulator [Chitinophagaceae bacterium]